MEREIMPEDEHAAYCCMLRGLFITQMTGLEKAIDTYISNYITADTDKQIEIFVLLLDRITLDGKRTAFEAILKKNNTASEYKKNYKKLVEEIRKLIVKRNHFAHFAFDDKLQEELNPNRPQFGIGLIEFRNTVNTLWYSEDDIVAMGKLANDLASKIYEMGYKLTEGKRH